MDIALTRPYFAALWMAIPVIWVLMGRRRPWRNALAGALRTAVVLLLGLALCQPMTVEDSDRVNCIFCLDVSDSVPEAERSRAMTIMGQASAAMGDGDSAGLIVFGEQASMEISLTKDFRPDKILSSVGTDFTDISKAVERAAACFPERGHNRIVLFSDGNENLGKAVEAAHLAYSLGIEMVVVPLESWYRGSEVFVERLWTPPEVAVDTPFDVRLTVLSTTEGPAEIVLFRDRGLVARRSADLAKGKNVFRFADTVSQPGLHLFKAVVNAPQDSTLENNLGLSFTRGATRPQVLYVAGARDADSPLPRALQEQGLSVVRLQIQDLTPSMQRLLDYSAVILDDVPASSFSLEAMNDLEKYVRDTGGGLVMVGGDRSFGAGQYLATAVERALPVFMEAPARLEFPGNCLVLVLDKSASMSGYLKGTSKMEGAKTAAFSSVELLNPFDRVGILAFDVELRWIVPLTDAHNRKQVADALSALSPGGGTDLFVGLQEAFRVLRQVRAARKHVIALSDGLTLEAGFEDLVGAMREANITVSTVAIGSDADRQLMGRIADWGGGRSYYADDAANIPRIFAGETKVATSRLIAEAEMETRQVADGQMIAGFGPDGFPPVRGIVRTYPKPGSQTLLETDEGPLLVAWQYGLGRSVAYTSDLGPRWGSPWVLWPHYGKFVSQMVRWASRKDNPRNLTVEVISGAGQGWFTVDVSDDAHRFVNGLDLNLTVVGPSKDTSSFPLEQTAPGTYEGGFPARGTGEYFLTLSGRDGDVPMEPRSYGHAIAYTAEYTATDPDLGFLERVAAVTGGKVAVSPVVPEELFRSPRPLKQYGDPLWPHAAVLSLFLLVLDVAVRKIAVLRQQASGAP